jgi:hypothetical protein
VVTHFRSRYNLSQVDYRVIIKALRVQMEQIDRAIAHLESLSSSDALSDALQLPKRRGRKSMGADERKEVAARMRRYWTGRKKEQGITALACSRVHPFQILYCRECLDRLAWWWAGTTFERRMSKRAEFATTCQPIQIMSR